jgi:hypothetical protein
MIPRELVIDPSKVTVKMLNGTEVFCQHDGWENVAVFLFSAATTKPFCGQGVAGGHKNGQSRTLTVDDPGPLRVCNVGVNTITESVHVF